MAECQSTKSSTPVDGSMSTSPSYTPLRVGSGTAGDPPWSYPIILTPWSYPTIHTTPILHLSLTFSRIHSLIFSHTPSHSSFHTLLHSPSHPGMSNKSDKYDTGLKPDFSPPGSSLVSSFPSRAVSGPGSDNQTPSVAFGNRELTLLVVDDSLSILKVLG